MLKLESVGKIYLTESLSKIEAISNISLEIKEQEFISFVGPSGCGKTTLLRLLAGLEKPTNGKIIFNNNEIISPSKDIGLISQHFDLFPWLTVYENIAFGLRLRMNDNTIISQTANRYLRLTGLESFKDNYPHSLSGGMRQRVAIARTLANDSKVILLDEPFGLLDVQTRSQMQEFLAKLWEEEKKTMILVTHDVEEAIYLSDKVHILSTKPGAIKESIEIKLSRPRRPIIRFSDEFIKIKKHISYIIRSESLIGAIERRESTVDDPMKIGLNLWPGIAPFYIAENTGLLRKKDFKTEILNLEKDDIRVSALLNDQIDLLDVTLDTAIQLKDKIPDLKIVTVLNKSNGGDALVANKQFLKVTDLKGKKVALEKEWVSHFFLLYILNKFGMTSKDLNLIDVKGSDIGSALLSGKVDAGVLWEPWLSKVEELSDVNILASTKEYPVIYDVLVAKESFLENNKERVKLLVKSWDEAVRLTKKDKKSAIKIASSYFGISEEELDMQIEKLEFLESSETNSLDEIIKETQEVLIKENLLKNRFNPEELIA